jgi:hypothetical protein
VRRLLLAALLLLAAAPPAHAASFQVGAGEGPGVAIDDTGTAYVGWLVNPGDAGEQVQLCVIPPRARSCASVVPLGFPGEGYARSRVSVMVPAPNTVDVVVPRHIGPLAYAAYITRSTDGGRSFAPAVKLSDRFYEQAAPGPPGRIALVGGPGVLHVDSALADGRGGDGADIGGFLEAQFNDIATQGGDVFAASSDASATQVFRLPAGSSPNLAASWQPQPAPVGRQPELAGGPAGLVAMLEASTGQPNTLYVQRFDGAAWTAPVTVFDVLNNDFELSQNVGGRLSALKTDVDEGSYFLEYATSRTGGALWSSNVRVASFGDHYPAALEMATAARGRGVAVVADFNAPNAIRVARFTPRAAPVASRTFRGVRVQVREDCREELTLVVEAARGNVRVAPSSVLRRARFGRARGARRGFRTRFRARYELRRRHARVPVRLIPRKGKARTVRLRLRGCRRTT